jgi:hypothetical protein
MDRGGYGVWMGRKETNTVMEEKPEGKGPLRTPMSRQDNINMNLKETGWGNMAWTRIIVLRRGTSGMLL